MTKDLVTERLKLKDLYPERAEALAKEHDIDVEDLELVRKGIVAEKAEVNKDERAVTNYINTGKQDRDNEILEPEGAILTHYRQNPVVPYGHNYAGLPVAKNIWIKKDKKGLIAKTVFLKHQFADDVYRLYSEDVAGTGPAMKGWSVGFIPLKWEEPDGKETRPKEGEQDTRLRRRYKKWELMEYSAVMIPSNREALTEMVAKGLIKSDKLKKDIIECVGDECTVKEIITKPEETDNFIRIPVRDCKVTATITISEKEGITALYCGKIKKVRTYIFDKRPPYNWTMAKAKKWVEEHGKEVKIYETVNTLTNKEGVAVLYGGEEYYEDWEEKAKYNCECVKCGWKHTSEKHCNTYKCEKCGGTMRRVGRPGPGQESADNLDSFDFLKDERENIYSIELKQTTIKGLNKLKEKGYISPQQFEDTILGTIKIDEYDTGTTKIRIGERDLYFNENGLLDGTGSGSDECGEREVVELEDKKKRPVKENVEEESEQTEREQQITRELFDRTTEQLNKIEEELKSLKEGRVLSEKNRKLVKQCSDMLLELYNATEPPAKAEEVDLDLIKENPTDKKVNLSEQNILDIVRDVFQTHLAKMIEEQEKTRKMIDKARGKVE